MSALTVVIGLRFLEGLSDSCYQCPSCKDFHVREPDEWDSGDYRMLILGEDDVWEIDSSTTEMHWSGFYEVDFCWPCVENDQQHASTMIRIEAPDGDKEVVRFGECEVHDIHLGECPAWFEETGFQHRDWRSTDAWRGYHDTKFENLTEIESGWMTGDWDDVPWKRDIHRFGEALENGEISPPVDLYLCLEPTSNVFSTACTIYARNSEVDELRAWLNSLDYDLHRALS